MSSYRWLKREGQEWVGQGIIEEYQLRQILKLYENNKVEHGVLPLLGGILLGLGILSFVAAHWSGISDWLRLTLILLLLVGLYTAGEIFYRRSHPRIGIGLTGAGVLSFGAGIFLIAQMYHLTSHNAVSYIVWGCAGLFTAYLYRSGFVYLLSALILTAGQIIDTAQNDSFSFTLLGVVCVLMSLYFYMDRRVSAAGIWASTLYLQAVIGIAYFHVGFGYNAVAAVWLFALSGLPKTIEIRSLQQTVALIAGFLITFILAVFPDGILAQQHVFFGTRPWLFGGLSLAGLAVSILLNIRYPQERRTGAWFLFLPMGVLPQYWGIAYLASLAIFSLSLLLRGYAEHNKIGINTGTGVFLLCVMAAYFKLTWGFMEKSVFFLTGGVLLLLLSWLLGRKRNRALKERGGGERQ